MSPKDHVAVRLDGATLARIDALKEVLSTAWHEATRSDVLRAVILTGLENLEHEHRAALAKRKASSDAGAPPSKPAGAAPKASASKSAPPSKPGGGAAKRGRPRKGRPSGS